MQRSWKGLSPSSSSIQSCIVRWREHSSEFGVDAVLRGLPHIVHHSECVSGLVESAFDVIACSSIISYNASRI